MPITNDDINSRQFLTEMYRDSYFPNFMVDKVKAILTGLCEKIEEKKPQNPEELLLLTHTATEMINDLQEEFEENGSEIETAAREAIADDFDFIVKTYGFDQVDIEDVIEPRDW